MRELRTATKQKASGAHFTPPELARFLAARIANALPEKSTSRLRVLDPACGDGELLLAFAEALSPEVLGRTTLIGVETDASHVARAKSRLGAIPVGDTVLQTADFLDLCALGAASQPSLFQPAGQDASFVYGVDVIIANPPYVRTQVLGRQKARELAAAFGLSGRVDLYQAFLVAMTQCLAAGGVMGAITSNRFLSTRAGACTRDLLAREYDIVEVSDLGDTRLFGAAVLPCVFVGRKRLRSDARREAQCSRPRFARVYEVHDRKRQASASPEVSQSILQVLESRSDGLYSVGGRIFEVASGELTVPAAAREPWQMATEAERKWLDDIRASAACTISDVATVRVGIKTTADAVFIKRNWSVLPVSCRPEDQLLLPLLSSGEADRWLPQRGPDELRRVLYTHEVDCGQRRAIQLDRFPRAAAYLASHRGELAKRKYIMESGRNWYEIWVPQDPEAWAQPKVVFPDISPGPRFFFDGQGSLVDGNCYWIVVDPHCEEDLLFLILGIANSALVGVYHDLCFANRLYAGRRRYLTQYVQNYPLPELEERPARRIAGLVRDFVLSGGTESDRATFECEVETAVAEAFNVEAARAREG